MTGGTITAIVAAIASLGVAALSLLGARSAQKATAETQTRQATADAKVEREAGERDQAKARAVIEAQAYERARESYERIVKDLESQLERNQRTVERVQDQLDRVMVRLADEQSVNNGLRDQMVTMRRQIDELQRENEQFKATIAEHQKIAGTLAADLRRAGIPPPEKV